MPLSKEEKRERHRIQTRVWRANNREKHLQQLRESSRRSNQKPERKEYMRLYRLKEYQMDIEAGRKRQRDGYKARRARDPEGAAKEYFRRNIKTKHGITPEQYEEMFRLQDFKCAICKTDDPGDKRGWQIDHCHDSQKIRGVLCRHCNLLLGYARDNAQTLLAAAAYVDKASDPAFVGFGLSKVKRWSKVKAIEPMNPTDAIG